jgi:hypothetical protein
MGKELAANEILHFPGDRRRGRARKRAQCVSRLLSGPQRLSHLGVTTRTEMLANIREAAELYVEDLQEVGEAIPVDPEQGAGKWPMPAVAVNV